MSFSIPTSIQHFAHILVGLLRDHSNLLGLIDENLGTLAKGGATEHTGTGNSERPEADRPSGGSAASRNPIAEDAGIEVICPDEVENPPPTRPTSTRGRRRSPRRLTWKEQAEEGDPSTHRGRPTSFTTINTFDEEPPTTAGVGTGPEGADTTETDAPFLSGALPSETPARLAQERRAAGRGSPSSALGFEGIERMDHLDGSTLPGGAGTDPRSLIARPKHPKPRTPMDDLEGGAPGLRLTPDPFLGSSSGSPMSTMVPATMMSAGGAAESKVAEGYGKILKWRNKVRNEMRLGRYIPNQS